MASIKLFCILLVLIMLVAYCAAGADEAGRKLVGSEDQELWYKKGNDHKGGYKKGGYGHKGEKGGYGGKDHHDHDKDHHDHDKGEKGGYGGKDHHDHDKDHHDHKKGGGHGGYGPGGPH